MGTNTVASMRSGLYFGAIGMIDGILERIIEKMGPETVTVATGGQAHMIVAGSRYLKTRGRAPHARRPANDLGTQPSDLGHNYFNYFTEIEEHFQRARGTSLFLLSPLDWALVESWKNAEVPLEAVLRGIDAAFEKWRARKVKTQMVNSLAFCAQAVLTEAQIMAGARAGARAEGNRAAVFAGGTARVSGAQRRRAARRVSRTPPPRCAPWPPRPKSISPTWNRWSGG